MSSNLRSALVLVLLSGILGALANSASAAVIIVANRTQAPIRFAARPHPPGAVDSRPATAPVALPEKTTLPLGLAARGSKAQRHMIEAGDCIALTLESSEILTVEGAGIGTYDLAPYRVYYFGSTRAGNVELREIGLAGVPDRSPPQVQELVGAQARLRTGRAADNDRDREARRTITAAIYVDDEEPLVEHLWRKRLEDRVGEAAKIFERSCGMKLAVKTFGKWETDDAVHDFELSLREFERKVRPQAAHVAIGFTSQYQITRGRTHLGGTHGPLHTHILLREWSQYVSEPERLELLVHELGHFLGAAHSPENNSVMRPLLGDRQARARAFRIAFDPVNALAMSVVGEEIRDRGITSFSQLSEPSRARLAAVYSTLAQAIPDDPAPAAYLRYVQQHRPLGGTP